MALGVLVILVGAAAAVAIALKSSKATLTTDPTALAKVTLPLGGGTIESVSAYGGPTKSAIPVHLQGKQIWPNGKIPAHTTLSVQVVVKRPSSVAWVTGKTEHLNLTLTTPSAHLKAHFLTVASGQPLHLQFAEPVSTVSTGVEETSLHRQVLSTPQSTVTLPRTAEAGTVYVAAAPRTWESSSAALVSWFPAGSATSAIAYPQPGSTISANTPITLTFNKPVSKALGGSMPPVLPKSSGTWHTINAHSIQFQPSGFGYGLGAHVTVGLPNGVRLVGAQQSGDAWGSWTVPGGNPLRLQQLLAVLGYLPLRFRYDGTGPGPSTVNQLAAAIKPPAGHFTWRYPNTPSALVNMWAPGTFGEMTKGAIMAFENSNGMTADGIPGPQVWNALITAAVQGKTNTFGYTFVLVSEGSPESQSTWHNGKTVVSGPVNTGIPAAPTAQGVFAVFEHAPSVTMSGTNPDGSHYDDPGVPWVSYFNGGDALHGFLRASYGSAQSLGCVEMPYSEAHDVYQYTPIGTLVDVT
ncbi:MAG TPA: L,D-transpeptidase family protein [Solirubrobacteraceae bacterium]|nr:L,D-transpeptidase family protein [Solirubrobacteraceae bacterium]